MAEVLLFTKTDLLEWLDRNNPPKGLSEAVIAPQRAWSIAHNPYAGDDDPLVAAIYDGGELACYTASFPEMIDGVRKWWFSALYCSPKFEGKGYGLIAVGSLAEIYGEENILDRWGAQETVKIFEFLGCEARYSNRYVFSDKQINRSSFKGRLSYLAQQIKKGVKRRKTGKSDCQYSLNYLSHIDDRTYSFMESHRKDNLFLHTKEMLNWEIQYPFMQTSPLAEKVSSATQFSSNVTFVAYVVVQVLVLGEIIGCYVLKMDDSTLKVPYIYYEEKDRNIVFASILDHIVKRRADSFETEDKALADFVSQRYFFPRTFVEKVSFSCPRNSSFAKDGYSFQLGDGDSFA